MYYYVSLSTSQYIREGFVDPRLNVLFLVHPFLWDGILKQNVGRLHRDNDNKELVKVYDFIDIKIPVFASMYDTRLKNYKKIGYNINEDNEYHEKNIYNYNEYEEILQNDLKNSHNVIFIIDEYNNDKIISLLEIIKCNVEIYANINCEDIIYQNVKSFNKIKETINAIIIDNHIMWYGGINPFNDKKSNNSIMRIDDKYVSDNLLKEIQK